MRSQSGVSVVAVMTKPTRCPHGKCIYCPGGVDSFFGSVPQSYTGKEPATRRAIRNRFDPYLQIFNRLEQYIASGHLPEKIELIVMGGTFTALKKQYQNWFIKNSFKAMNDFSNLFFKKNNFDMKKFKEFFELPGKVDDPLRQKHIRKKVLEIKNKRKISLSKEQKINEHSNVKCVGLTIETRPDYAKLKQADYMLKLGATRVEIGVQTVYNDVLDYVKRGHKVEDSIESTRILKDLGFKINYHIMLGLPKSNKDRDKKMLKTLFEDENFRPDMLKIYPTMVIKGTLLYELWKKGKYKAITTKDAIDILTDFMGYVPRYVRIMRIQRDIPTYVSDAGVKVTNLRQYVEENMKQKGIKGSDIRSREIGLRINKNELDIKNIKPEINLIEYNASKGKEFFISIDDINSDSIIGFCRLRFPSQYLRKEITEKSALIRELHVYGKTTEIGKKGKIQHKGFGKKLLKKAEDIARENGKNKIVIISGIGVRDYYRKLGYKLQGPYMVKYL